MKHICWSIYIKVHSHSIVAIVAGTSRPRSCGVKKLSLSTRALRLFALRHQARHNRTRSQQVMGPAPTSL